MKKLIAAATILATVAAVAAPAMADDDTIFGFSSHYMAQDIEAQGFDVQDVSEWGSLVVATVTDETGHSSFAYFEPISLKRVR